MPRPRRWCSGVGARLPSRRGDRGRSSAYCDSWYVGMGDDVVLCAMGEIIARARWSWRVKESKEGRRKDGLTKSVVSWSTSVTMSQSTLPCGVVRSTARSPMANYSRIGFESAIHLHLGISLPTFGSVQIDHTLSSSSSCFHLFRCPSLTRPKVVHAWPEGGTDCRGS